MLIYLRHGNDHVDDPRYRHDRHLSGRGERKAAKRARQLIKDYGHPVAIFVSPYQRALETVKAMAERFERPVDVQQDPRLACLLSKKQQRGLHISPQTATMVPVVESRDDFRRRVQGHVGDMRTAGHHQSASVVWIVTHKIVLSHAARQFGVKPLKDADFLDYIVVHAVAISAGRSDAF